MVWWCVFSPQSLFAACSLCPIHRGIYSGKRSSSWGSPQDFHHPPPLLKTGPVCHCAIMCPAHKLGSSPPTEGEGFSFLKLKSCPKQPPRKKKKKCIAWEFKIVFLEKLEENWVLKKSNSCYRKYCRKKHNCCTTTLSWGETALIH